MATCPKCLGALTEHHRCPHGIWRRITEALSTVSVGGLLGALFCYVVNDQPAAALVVAFAALGAVLTSAVRQAVGGRS